MSLALMSLASYIIGTNVIGTNVIVTNVIGIQSNRIKQLFLSISLTHYPSLTVPISPLLSFSLQGVLKGEVSLYH
jgi:hypothetical protein